MSSALDLTEAQSRYMTVQVIRNHDFKVTTNSNSAQMQHIATRPSQTTATMTVASLAFHDVVRHTLRYSNIDGLINSSPFSLLY